MVSAHKLKKEVRQALAEADFQSIARLAVENRKVLGILISQSFNKDDVMCWRAIEAMGIAAAEVSKKNDPALARNAVTRIIWSAREESGGMGWSAPELLGEIVRGSPRAYPDLPTLILSLNGEDEEGVFLRGVLWALGRMAEAGVTDVEGARKLVLDSLVDPEPRTRGLAARAAGRMTLDEAIGTLRAMEDENCGFIIYEDTEFVETSVGREAAGALGLLV